MGKSRELKLRRLLLLLEAICNRCRFYKQCFKEGLTRFTARRNGASKKTTFSFYCTPTIREILPLLSQAESCYTGRCKICFLVSIAVNTPYNPSSSSLHCTLLQGKNAKVSLNLPQLFPKEITFLIPTNPIPKQHHQILQASQEPKPNRSVEQ